MAVGLVHYPIYDGQKKVVATNITNFDIHDIARASRVFGVDKYFLIHPMQDQLMFVERVLDHWRVGYGAKYNPKRKTALVNVHTAENLEHAKKQWGQKDVMVIATHAREDSSLKRYSFREMRHLLHDENKAIFLIFGTGFGLTEEFMQACDGVLEPITGAPPLDYRHLSVRSAASICLDRLMGSW